MKHFCPDCSLQLAEGYDRFGNPCPCNSCALRRLDRAYLADLDDPVAIIRPVWPGVRRSVAEEASLPVAA